MRRFKQEKPLPLMGAGLWFLYKNVLEIQYDKL
jgi:hypothetical protein